MSGAADRGSMASSGDEREMITVACISHNELANIINGSRASLANGVPVLIVRSSDGRLAQVAVNGLQILVPTTTTTNREEDRPSVENRDGDGRPKDISAWLLLLASLVASITYTVGMAPPGGVWSADDQANGYVAGNPVLFDKSRGRYYLFYYGNTTAFVSSLLIIAMLSDPVRSTAFLYKAFFSATVAVCLMSLTLSYGAGAIGVRIELYVYMAAFILGEFVILIALKLFRGRLP